MFIIHKGYLNFDLKQDCSVLVNIVNDLNEQFEPILQVNKYNYLAFNRKKGLCLDINTYKNLPSNILPLHTFTTPIGFGIYLDVNIITKDYHNSDTVFLSFSYIKANEDIDWDWFFSIPYVSINIPAYGWCDNQWFDGEILCKTSDNRIITFISKGYPCSMLLSLKHSNDTCDRNQFLKIYELKKFDFMIESIVNSWKEYIKLYFNISYTNNYVLIFSIKEFNLLYAIALVCLKKAYPTSNIFLYADIPYIKFPSSWKRLSQNLGIGMFDKKNPVEEYSLWIDVEKIINIIPSDKILYLKNALNQISDIIPHNLY